MPMTLEALAAEIRTALERGTIDEVAPEICASVSRALTDDGFVARHLPDRSAGAHPREVLYEDADLGFCICGHVFEGPAETGPHDHGNSWAVYGQASGETEMTDWQIVQEGTGESPIMVEPARRYTLARGDAHFYGVGAVHSPKRVASTRLVRVEGANLDTIKRSNIRAA
ncbi:MAG: hypothetical protein AAF674_21790 [Pseudomonadota bacterium]